MTTRTFVDAEGPCRTFLRGNAIVTAVAGQRIFIGTPKDEESVAEAGPFASLFLVSDVPDPNGQLPMSRALLQHDCYALTRQAASRLAYAVVTAWESMDAMTLLDSTLRCLSASVTRCQWLPDTSAPIQPRYSVDVLLRVVATGQ